MWGQTALSPIEYLPEHTYIQGNSIQAMSAPFLPYTCVYGAIITPQSEKIIECESRWNENARGKAGEIGIAQFLPKTFYWMSELSGIEGSIYDPEIQVKILNWALENNLGKYWTCFKYAK